MDGLRKLCDELVARIAINGGGAHTVFPGNLDINEYVKMVAEYPFTYKGVLFWCERDDCQAHDLWGQLLSEIKELT